MSAREAYIAGRSGGSRPKSSSSTGSPGSSSQRQEQQDREQKSFDAGQQERQREVRAQVTKEKGTGPNVKGGLTEKELEQARNIASGAGGIPTLKDPYNVLTREEERKAGYPETFSEKAIDAYKEYANFGGFMGLGALPFRMIAEPTVKTFQNPKTLASLKLLFDRKGQEFKDRYLKDYKELINEAFKDETDQFKEDQGFEMEGVDLFNSKLNENAFASEQGILGAGSQEINFPTEFYTGEKGLNPYGAGGMPQTTGGLTNLAGLDVNQFTSGPGYNQEMVDMIFAARMELDRMGKNPMTGESQGQGGQGITSIPSSNFINTITPDSMNIAKYPEGYGAFLLNPPAPVRPGTPTTPGFPDQDGDGVDDRYQAGPGISRPGTIDSVLPLKPKTNLPAAFNYASIAPQFTGSQYTNQGVSPAFLENLRRFYG